MTDLKIYGHKEHAYADVFANTLCDAPEFLSWVLKQTPLVALINARVVRDEMIVKRPKAKFWWKNYWTARCSCAGCSGSETDIFVVCADQTDDRFALHIEVKQPTDRFDPKKKQGERYRLRAACWVEEPPAKVSQHSRAATLLLCSDSKLALFAEDVAAFDATITFESIAANYPAAVPRVLI